MIQKTYIFDVDGTICTHSNSKYETAKPLVDRIKVVNNLFTDGHKIIIMTSRGMTTGLDWEDLTKRQLREWGVLYHELHMRKIFYDIWVDDKAVSDFDFFKDKAV